MPALNHSNVCVNRAQMGRPVGSRIATVQDSVSQHDDISWMWTWVWSIQCVENDKCDSTPDASGVIPCGKSRGDFHQD